MATSTPAALGLDGGAEPGEAAADDDELMMDHVCSPQLTDPGPEGPGAVDDGREADDPEDDGRRPAAPLCAS